MKRCWNNNFSKEMLEYHDNIWGKPEQDDNELFAKLSLECFQGGLSWEIVFNKEKIIRENFDNFDIEKVSRYDDKKVMKIINYPKMIKNELKIRGIINNAIKIKDIQKEYGSFNNYIWSFTNNKIIDNHLLEFKDIPTHNELSDCITKDLKKRGFKYIGTITIYSYLQAIGIVNDHLEYCDYR